MYRSNLQQEAQTDGTLVSSTKYQQPSMSTTITPSTKSNSCGSSTIVHQIRALIRDQQYSKPVRGTQNTMLVAKSQQQIYPYWKTATQNGYPLQSINQNTCNPHQSTSKEECTQSLFQCTNKTPSVHQTPKDSTQEHHSKLQVTQELTKLPGMEYSSNSSQQINKQEATESESHSCTNSPSHSTEDDGQNSQIQSISQITQDQATHWALTTWQDTIHQDAVVAMLKGLKNVKGWMYLEIHSVCLAEGKAVQRDHRHWLVSFTTNVRMSVFLNILKLNHWVRPMKTYKNDNIQTALSKYKTYIKQKGDNWKAYNIQVDDIPKQTDKMKKTEKYI